MSLDIYEATLQVMGYKKKEAPGDSAGVILVSPTGESQLLCYKYPYQVAGHITWDPETYREQAMIVLSRYMEDSGNEVLLHQEVTKDNTCIYVCYINGLVAGKAKDLSKAILSAICAELNAR